MDHLGKFIGQQAHLVVVALHGAIEGDVFLDHHGAQGGGGNGYFDSPFMAGIAHGRLGQVAQTLEVAQVDVLERGGIGGIAVEQHVAGPFVLEMANAGADLHFRGHAGGADQGFAGGGQAGEQGVVGEIGRRHLEAFHPPAVELVEAGFIPRGTEGHQAFAGGVVKAAEQLVITELKSLEQIQGVLGAQIGGHVVAVARIAVQPAHVPHLELGAVRPCQMGGINQLESGVEIAVVVVADLGDQEAGSVIANAAGADLEPVGGTTGHGDDAAMAVEQRQRNDP